MATDIENTINFFLLMRPRIAILALLLFAAAGCNSISPSRTTQSKQTPTADTQRTRSRADTYINTTYGFQFTLPQAYTADEYSTIPGYDEVTVKAANGVPAITITITPAGGESLNTLVSRSLGDANADISHLQIDGNPAVRESGRRESSGGLTFGGSAGAWVRYYLIHNGSFLTLAVLPTGESGSGAPNLLDSFHFTR